MARINERHGGARKGAGRKPKATEDEIAALMDESWPLARRKKAIEKHAKQAEEGDVKSFMGLMAYAYGKPKERQEITGASSGPVELIIRYADKK